MAVYVDAMMVCLPHARWPWNESCHLLADSLLELHEFARQVGLRRSWAQVSRSGVPHYDLTRAKRVLAVRYGAVEVTRIEGVRIMRAWRAAGGLDHIRSETHRAGRVKT